MYTNSYDIEKIYLTRDEARELDVIKQQKKYPNRRVMLTSFLKVSFDIESSLSSAAAS
jgi:hypothetical protein